MSDLPVGREPITNSQLGRYALVLALGMSAVQGYTALFAGSRITVVSALLLVGVASYALAFYLRHRPSLRMRPYGSVLLHVLTYAVVNGSYWIYAAVLVLTGNGEVLSAGWSGPLVAMSATWGIGLALHASGALLSRGYDDVAV